MGTKLRPFGANISRVEHVYIYNVGVKIVHFWRLKASMRSAQKSKSEHENVFKPFYKIDKSRADSKSSVGLGLSISSDVIRSHGGYIKLESSNMNGLRVKIFLPV